MRIDLDGVTLHRSGRLVTCASNVSEKATDFDFLRGDDDVVGPSRFRLAEPGDSVLIGDELRSRDGGSRLAVFWEFRLVWVSWTPLCRRVRSGESSAMSSDAGEPVLVGRAPETRPENRSRGAFPGSFIEIATAARVRGRGVELALIEVPIWPRVGADSFAAAASSMGTKFRCTEVDSNAAGGIQDGVAAWRRHLALVGGSEDETRATRTPAKVGSRWPPSIRRKVGEIMRECDYWNDVVQLLRRSAGIVGLSSILVFWSYRTRR